MVLVQERQRCSLTSNTFDAGGVERARAYAKRLKASLGIIDKRRDRANVSEVMHIIGDVKDKTVIVVDDMIDTAGTLTNAAGAEVPLVLGAITRAHVGVSGGLYPAQSDIRMLKGLGNGDYHLPLLVPYSVTETAQLTAEAFDIADIYSIPVIFRQLRPDLAALMIHVLHPLVMAASFGELL